MCTLNIGRRSWDASVIHAQILPAVQGSFVLDYDVGSSFRQNLLKEAQVRAGMRECTIL